MNIDLEKDIVQSLSSLYPLQEFEERAIDTVLNAIPHWIPVEQDLPKENYLADGYVEPSQYVLVCVNYHICKVSRYWGHRKSKGVSDYVIPDWMDLEDWDSDNVVAWMPLPEPYKGVIV